MSDDKRNLWVYGVVPADAELGELERRGDNLPDVSVVEAGDLAAIVGDVPEGDAKATRDQALAHARVLEAAVADATVVPFRFGVIVPGDDEVASELLDPRRDELKQLMERVEGRVQMTLKVYYDEDVLLREIVDEESEIGELREQLRGGEEAATRDVRVRIGELVNRALEERRQNDSAEILEQLKPVSIAAMTEGLEKEFMVLNAPILIERDRRQELEDAVEGLAQERQKRMKFRLLGPMPAYNFIDVEEPAWA